VEHLDDGLAAEQRLLGAVDGAVSALPDPFAQDELAHSATAEHVARTHGDRAYRAAGGPVTGWQARQRRRDIKN
jgi:hypothetical protein